MQYTYFYSQLFPGPLRRSHFHAPFTSALAPEFVPNSESHVQVNFKVEAEGS